MKFLLLALLFMGITGTAIAMDAPQTDMTITTTSGSTSNN